MKISEVENQGIEEKKFDKLVKLYDELKNFKINESASILDNFYVNKFKVQCEDGKNSFYHKFQLNKNDRNYELQLNLSSTIVCTYVLSIYSNIWSDKDKERFADTSEYYNFIMYGLKKCVEHDECEPVQVDFVGFESDNPKLEPIDEFSLLNILSLLKNTIPSIEENNILIETIKILCKQFVIEEIPSFRKGEEKHPFIFYKFLRMISDWDEMIKQNMDNNPEEWKHYSVNKDNPELKIFVDGVNKHGSVFKHFFDEIYTDAKYEIYRQLSLYHAHDLSLFDVKRLIYALLIIKLNDRYSNDLMVKKVLDLIFEIQYDTTGLWPICHGVNSDFYVDDGKIKEEYKEGVIISGSPVLSSIECLSDMLGHENIRLDDKYYEKIKITYDWILNRIIKEDGTKIGWYPEYERDRTPKSWTTGHTLIFLKRYCDGISKLIEEEASKWVSAEDSAGFKDWNNLVETYGTKEIIKKYTIEEIKDRGDSKYRSMILFGPPGTGKSTVGKVLAKELKWDYVELTPGLFLDEGDNKIISKLNRIFKRLVKLNEKVIFFDEVDQLVEKRGKDKQSNWIVTSILPKLSELREQKNIIFIMATNHIEKVDDAIMRLGRIDLVLPMGAISWRSRLEMLRKKIKFVKKGDFKLIKNYFESLSEEDKVKNLSEEDEVKYFSEKYNANKLPIELTTYLKNTTYIPFVQIDRMLEEILRGTCLNCYDIFFGNDPKRKSEKLKDDEFEKFENGTSDETPKINYSRLPTNEEIDKYTMENMPQYEGYNPTKVQNRQ